MVEDVVTRIISVLKVAALIITWPLMGKRMEIFPDVADQKRMLIFYESLQGITLVSLHIVIFFTLFRISRTMYRIIPAHVSRVPKLLWIACGLIGLFDVLLFIIIAEQNPAGNLIATCIGAWNSAVILKILVLVKAKHRQYSKNDLSRAHEASRSQLFEGSKKSKKILSTQQLEICEEGLHGQYDERDRHLEEDVDLEKK